MAVSQWFLGLFGRKNKDVPPATPSIGYSDQTIIPNAEETVLEALLRNGFAIPNSCRAGACQSCLMVADEQTRANLPAAAQEPLTAAEKQQGLFLACCARINAPINASMPSALVHPETEATITEIRKLNERVVRLLLNAPLNYHPGQFINLGFKDSEGQTVHRSYSLASLPSTDSPLELHIKLLRDGQCSEWLGSRVQAGETVTLQGPHGHCYYTDECNNAPHIVLAGIGTGLAPLWGIVRDALDQGFTGTIDFLVGAKTEAELYYVEELKALAAQHNTIRLQLLVQTAQQAGPWQEGDIYEAAKQLNIDFSRATAFLCGAESFVQKMKKSLFLKGTSMKSIFADAFVKS